jgi:hypothetical protein
MFVEISGQQKRLIGAMCTELHDMAEGSRGPSKDSPISPLV